MCIVEEDAHHIQASYRNSTKDSPIILCDDNVAYIAQLKGNYIKKDRKKHVTPKFFYTHEFKKISDIDVQ